MKLEEKMMLGLGNFVIRFKKIIPFAALVLFILSIIAAGNIESKTEIKDMMPEDDPQVISYTEIDDLFFGGSTAIITIEGNDKERMIQCAEELVTKIEDDEELTPLIKPITLKLDRDFIRDWGLIMSEAEDLERTKKTFGELNLLPFISNLNDSFEAIYTGEEAEEELETSSHENEAVIMLNQMEEFFTLLREYLSSPDQISLEEQGRILAETFMYGQQYNFNYDNSMMMFSIYPNFNIMDINKMVAMMERVREHQADLKDKYPDVFLSYTGEIPIGADEMAAMNATMVIPALIAFILILILFIFSFDQMRSIFFILICLIIGVVYSYGFIGITTGELNMMTSIMAVLLIGLGVDYGIQFVTNFNNYRREGLDPPEALHKSYNKAGMGIILAALTTAIAFFVMALTGTRIFAEFGILLGLGIIFCLLSMIIILPAMLLWWGKKDFTRSRIPTARYKFLTRAGKSTYEHKIITLVVMGVLSLGLTASMLFLSDMESDMMNLEPPTMPSIIQYRKIMDKFGITPFQSMVIAKDLKEARELTEKLENEYMVGSVTSLADFVPSEREQEERLQKIAEIRNMEIRYRDLQYSPDDITAFADEIQRLEWNIIEIGDLSIAGLGEDNKITRKRNAMIREILGAESGEPGEEVFQKLINLSSSDPENFAGRLTALDRHFATAMDGIVGKMVGIKEKITVHDIPESLSKGLLHEDKKRNLILIYPIPGTFSDMESMRRLNKAMARISDKITGMTQISVAWLDDAIQGSLKSGIYIFIAIVFFILINFRSLRLTIYAIIPLMLGLIWMVGLYSLIGLKLNFFNIIMIPLIIGMGIDFSIHMVHRFDIEQDIETVYRYTGKAVFLSAFTTMIGFGSLGLIGSYPAISTLGAILFFGISSCLVTTMIITPALFSLGGRGKSKAENDSETEEQEK